MQADATAEDRSGASPARPSRRKLLNRQERQASILRAAAAAFARGGFAATSMDDVAREAGVTRLIVYRHFESKEQLYRAVLERVATRLKDRFVEGLNRANPRDFTVRVLLDVAREDPDGFRLLLVHAVREPQFAAYAEQIRGGAIAIADELIGDTIDDPSFRRWATATIIAYLDDSVLNWLDRGAPELDEEFVDRATAGLVAMYRAWVGRIQL